MPNNKVLLTYIFVWIAIIAALYLWRDCFGFA